MSCLFAGVQQGRKKLILKHQTILSLAALTDALEDDVKAGLRTESRR